MERTYEDQLDALAAQMRQGAEGLIKESSTNIEFYDRLRWHMAAECSHAVAIMRVIEHRDQVMAALLDRLQPQQLEAPPAPPQVPPAREEEDVGSGLREMINRMRSAEAKEAQLRRQSPPPVPPQPPVEETYEDWGHQRAYEEFYRQKGYAR